MASGIKLTVDLRGFKEFAEKLEFAPSELRDVKKSMLYKATSIALDKAKSLAPIDDGTLKQSITSRVSIDTGRVGTDIKYAVYQEYGTGIYSQYPGAPRQMIRPKKGKFIVFMPKSSKGKYVTSRNNNRYYKKGTGKLVFAKAVKGSKPVFFMKQGYEEVNKRLDEVLDVGRKFISNLNF